MAVHEGANPYQPPPYAPPRDQSHHYGATDEEPLLGSDPEDDFKYGVTVSQSAQSIRHAFIRKVYTILFMQILGTTLVGWLMSTEKASNWTREHPVVIFLPTIAALFVMFGIWWKRHSYPTNLILLGLFTVLESVGIGAIVSFYQQKVVLQALLITIFVFLGLTLFTFQSKIDFSQWGTYLFGALLVFCVTGLVGIFIPFSKTVYMIYSAFGVLIFSGYIIFDTHMICNKLSPDEWVLACVSLYLDIINLFLSILRLLDGSNND